MYAKFVALVYKHNYMRLSKNSIVAIVALAIVSGLFITMSVCNRQASENLKRERERHYLSAATIHKTIPGSKTSIADVGFTLHEEPVFTGSYGSYHVFSAIISDVDPAKENYKAMCYDIISDIIQTCEGNSEIVVNIYDSVEAYNLAGLAENHIVITDEQHAYINAHHIAAYGLACKAGGAPGLIFYPDVTTRYHEETTLSESASSI